MKIVSKIIVPVLLVISMIGGFFVYDMTRIKYLEERNSGLEQQITSYSEEVENLKIQTEELFVSAQTLEQQNVVQSDVIDELSIKIMAMDHLVSQISGLEESVNQISLLAQSLEDKSFSQDQRVKKSEKKNKAQDREIKGLITQVDGMRSLVFQIKDLEEISASQDLKMVMVAQRIQNLESDVVNQITDTKSDLGQQVNEKHQALIDALQESASLSDREFHALNDQQQVMAEKLNRFYLLVDDPTDPNPDCMVLKDKKNENADITVDYNCVSK